MVEIVDLPVMCLSYGYKLDMVHTYAKVVHSESPKLSNKPTESNDSFGIVQSAVHGYLERIGDSSKTSPVRVHTRAIILGNLSTLRTVQKSLSNYERVQSRDSARLEVLKYMHI